MPKHQLTGVVISNKMQKTVVVRVEKVKEHHKYKKIFRLHKKYKAHAVEPFKVGDVVVIEESAPISKDKKWKVVKKIANSKEEETPEL